MVERVARACEKYLHSRADLGAPINYDDLAREALDAIPYAAMREALYAAETVMMIVEPRSHKSEYLETLGKVRAALRAADGGGNN